MPLFSIITVCYNAKDHIKRTLESVYQQTYKNYEYIIIDGQSQDCTVQIANSYCQDFKKMGIKYVIVSEKDFGIYNAMNKGIKKATGKWMIFLNAGDCFFNENVLQEVSEVIDSKYGVCFGSTYMKKDNMFVISKPIENAMLPEVIPTCHQSIFWESTLLKKYQYDERFRICADRECLTRYMIDDIPCQLIDTIISKYELDGVSANEIYKLRKEVWEIRKSLFHITWMDYLKSRLALSFAIILEILRNIFPKTVLCKLNEIRFSLQGWERY